ncbi:MAG TPA: enoyl-CoA hydratase-related protein [Candidatus Eremiobacteraceae bacterium]|nr:enoyl-CoA hydratase-related protein [Candidatus Eremiobacteraceae bacterium]
MPDTIALERDRYVATVRLNRPDVRNALNATMIADLTAAFAKFSEEPDLRAIVIEGEGKAFCGGADIHYMREGLDLGERENYEDALRLSAMFAAIDTAPMPVLARVHGAALGGGSGMVAACDIVIAADDALFGFTEVKLGIVPAVISPFVMRKIGASHARALFLTGERFDAHRARAIGLVHEVVPYADLHAALAKKVEEILASGPEAVRVAKQIARVVPWLSAEEAPAWTARTTAVRRASDEGQEGLRAFLEKRKPAWR